MIKKTLIACVKLIQEHFGREKPYALRINEWEDFRKRYKKEEPYRFFFCESLPNKVVEMYTKVVTHNLVRLLDFIIFHCVKRPHVVNTGLPRSPVGFTTSELLLHSNFKVLESVIENQVAIRDILRSGMCDLSRTNKIMFNMSKRSDIVWLFMTQIIKSPYHGIKGIDTLIKECDEYQDLQDKYKEIKSLYLWYCARKLRNLDNEPSNPYKEFEVEIEFAKKKHGNLYMISPAFKNEKPELYSKLKQYIHEKTAHEESILREDQIMIERLVKVRNEVSNLASHGSDSMLLLY